MEFLSFNDDFIKFYDFFGVSMKFLLIKGYKRLFLKSLKSVFFVVFCVFCGFLEKNSIF